MERKGIEWQYAKKTNQLKKKKEMKRMRDGCSCVLGVHGFYAWPRSVGLVSDALRVRSQTIEQSFNRLVGKCQKSKLTGRETCR